MEKRTLGRTGMKVSVIGFGGSEIGYLKTDRETVSRLLNEALDAGMNVIDTAECYPGSEEMLGLTVAHRRSEYFLFSKTGHDGKSFGLPDWDPGMITKQVDRTLERLKTDRLDLLQVHTCTFDELKQGDIIAAVQKARDAGKTRFIGYSGDSLAAKFAIESGVFDVLQTSVNIADQEAIELTLPLCQKHNLGVIAKRPVANVAWLHKGTFLGGYDRTYWERLEKLQYPFLRKPLGEAVATALRFTMYSAGLTMAIIGTTKPGRFVENAGFLEAGPLAAGEYQAIRERWRQVAQADWVGQM